MLGGDELAVRTVRKRAAMHSIPRSPTASPTVPRIFAAVHEAPAWDETLAREPQPALTLEGEAIDRALAAIGDFADLVSPYLAGHSAGVAELASAAAHRCRIDAAGATRSGARRMSTTSDGSPSTPDLAEAGSAPDEWEQVRLHPYHTERVLSRSPFLSALGSVAGGHHERRRRATTAARSERSWRFPLACLPRPMSTTR